MKLYTYFRSSAAYRVRIVLALKRLEWTAVPIHMLRGGGEQFQPGYRAINPQSLVPTLEVDGLTIGQSTAICEYLEETVPDPPLLPKDPGDRAHVRWICNAIACDLHPVNNLRVLTYITQRLGASEDQKLEWYRHWCAIGLESVEAVVQSRWQGSFAFGRTPSLADAYIVPQVYNARRFGCSLDGYAALLGVEAACSARPEFQAAHPDRQVDAAA